jgi:hypothetical protein
LLVVRRRVFTAGHHAGFLGERQPATLSAAKGHRRKGGKGDIPTVAENKFMFHIDAPVGIGMASPPNNLGPSRLPRRRAFLHVVECNSALNGATPWW